LLAAGDAVEFVSYGWDKYGGRIDGSIKLADAKPLLGDYRNIAVRHAAVVLSGRESYNTRHKPLRRPPDDEEDHVFVPGFLSKVGPHRVERVFSRDFGEVDLSKPPVGVGHTTEGSFESALAKFEHTDAPNFMIGRDTRGKLRIIQFIELGRVAAALEHRKGTVETNRWARAQIELVGTSKKTSWLPADKELLDAFTQLVAILHQRCEIPLHRPFPDALIPTGIVWATTKNPRRLSGHWGSAAGWWNHLEVPGNEHWDMGAFRWTPVLRNAQSAVQPSPEPKPTKPPPWFWEWAAWRLGVGEFKPFGSAEPARRPPDAPAQVPDWAWKRLSRLVAAQHAKSPMPPALLHAHAPQQPQTPLH